MKVLVTGGNGQLGREFRLLAPAYLAHEFVFTDIGDLDLTDQAATERYISGGSFDGIINCAAYTAVDKAETEADAAMKINAAVPGFLASLSTRLPGGIIHFSTDYVFDGMKGGPYHEEDPPNPQSVYGKSKHLGEMEVIANARKGAIVRTSWLYSPFGVNFVRTILARAKEGDTLRVVSDQVGCPTYGHGLAKMVIEHIPEFFAEDKVEIYHYSDEGSVSWFEFATAILELSQMSCKVVPVLTSEYPTPARRPMYAVMSKEKIKKDLGITIQDWKTSLKECLARLPI